MARSRNEPRQSAPKALPFTLCGLLSEPFSATKEGIHQLQKLGEEKKQDRATARGEFRKSWLSKIGSPSSRIDRTNFSNEKTISKLEYSNFSIRY
ncbi:PREDICTED: acylphosphatase-2-like [Mandrillus leucophaeus]|uniref:acylphosphatase-2-like n=1 Tax=Mandrillus leucophaeus TaxID=9568 RepID=UPI0005F40ED0|nr:PREDICTED: acylphosphatase-2-like [Mandrillus leucophaeus]